MLNSFFATAGSFGSRRGWSSSTVAPRRSGYCSVTTAGMPRILPARIITEETCTQWSNPWMTGRKRSWTSQTKTAVRVGSSRPGSTAPCADMSASWNHDARVVTRWVVTRWVVTRRGFRSERTKEGVGDEHPTSRDMSNEPLELTTSR